MKITEHAAYQMGATGAEPTEYERLLFEAWMRGHCWKVCGEWNGKTYVADSEDGGSYVDHGAMLTRQLWAAWRDRAALTARTAPPAAEQPEAPGLPELLIALGCAGIAVSGGTHGDPWRITPPTAEQPDTVLSMLGEDDMYWLRRFRDCREDDEDEHDLPETAILSLEALGALRSIGYEQHELTKFGDYLLGKESV